MKSRGFLFIAGFILGLCAGILLGQEGVRNQLKSAIGNIAANADQQIRRLIERAKGGSTSASGSDAGQEVQVSPVSAPHPEKNQYIREHVQLTGVQAKMDPSKGSLAVITGRIKNSGDWALKRVSMTAYFMSENDIVFDQNILIVNDTPLMSKTDRTFSVRVEDVPHRWSGGKVRVAVTDIVFVD